MGKQQTARRPGDCRHSSFGSAFASAGIGTTTARVRYRLPRLHWACPSAGLDELADPILPDPSPMSKTNSEMPDSWPERASRRRREVDPAQNNSCCVSPLPRLFPACSRATLKVAAGLPPVIENYAVKPGSRHWPPRDIGVADVKGNLRRQGPRTSKSAVIGDNAVRSEPRASATLERRHGRGDRFFA